MSTIPLILTILFNSDADAFTACGLLVLVIIVVVGVLGGVVMALKLSKVFGLDDVPQKVPQKTNVPVQKVLSPSVPVQPQPSNKPLPLSKKSQPQTARDSSATPAIFISYRRDDTSDVTGRIYDRLIQHFGKPAVFKDIDSIPLGVDFRRHLGDSVGRCAVLLTIIGRQWLVGEVGERRLDNVCDFVRIEIEAALQRDIPVIPVLVQTAQVPRLDDLPETLQGLVYRNGIPVRTDPDFHQDVDRLIRGIEECLKKQGNKS